MFLPNVNLRVKPLSTLLGPAIEKQSQENKNKNKNVGFYL